MNNNLDFMDSAKELDGGNNFLYDAVNHPLDALGAVATDIGASLYNLASLTGVVDYKSQSEVMDFVSNAGFTGVEQYYTNHPEATQVMSMVAGGFMVGGVGAKLVSFGLSRGMFLATDSAQTISRTVRLQKEVEALAKGEAGVASEALNDAVKAYKWSNRGKMFRDGAANIAAYDLVFSQSYALKDAGLGEAALSMGIGGAANVGLNGIARAFLVVKDATSPYAKELAGSVLKNSNPIPHHVRGTLGEAVHLNAQGKVTESMLAAHPDVSKPIRTALENKGRIDLTRQLELIDNATHASLRVVQGASRTPEALKAGYHFESDLRTAVLKGVEDNATLAGARRVTPFKAEEHTHAFGHPIEDLFIQHGISADSQRVLLKGIHDEQQAGWKYGANESAVKLAKQLKIPQVVVDKVHKLNNSVAVDARTGTVLALEEAQSIATAADLGIKEVVKGVGHSKLLAGQVQYNNHQAISRASKAVAGSVKVDGDKIARADVSDLLYYKAAIQHGKVARGGLGHEASLKAIDDRLMQRVGDLKSKGMSNLEIGLRVHVDYKALDKADVMAADKVGRDEILLGADKGVATAQDVKSLAIVEGDAVLGRSTIEQAAALDADAVRTANNEFLSFYAGESDSALIRAQHEVTMGGLGAGMRQGLEGLNPALYSGDSVLSKDMAFRHQGKITDHVLAFGSIMMHEIQKGVVEATKDVNVALKQLSMDSVTRVKWNQSEAVLRSIQLHGDEAIVVQEGKLGVLSGKEFAVIPELETMPKEVVAFWENFQHSVSDEVRQHINFQRGLMGQEAAIPRGIKLPPKNLSKKEIAYAIDPKTNDITFYHADTPAALEGLVQKAKADYPNREILTKKSHLDRFNKIHDHVAVGEMRAADYNQAKGTTVFSSVDAWTGQMEAFVEANGQYLTRLAKKNARLMNPEVVAHLKVMDEITPDSVKLYRDLEQTAFSGSALANHKYMSQATDIFNNGINLVVGKLDELAGDGVRAVLDNAGRIVGKKPVGSYKDRVQAVVDDFEASGLSHELPWNNQVDALAETMAYKKLGDHATAVVSTNNFLVATLALRLWDWSHAIVTALSAPITILSEGAMHGDKFAPMKIMYEGARKAFHPENRGMMDELDRLGITNAEVSEVNDFLATQIAKPKLTAIIEGNPMFHFLQKPSEYSEMYTRKLAAGSAQVIYEAEHGVGSAMSGEGLAFINTFVKRTMGNYTTAQRPAMFQGNLGAAVGLFQTFTWTMGQSIFRGLEAGNRMSTGALLATQGSVFGLRSLPGYDLVNHYMGASYGENNGVDITTHIYEGAGNNRQAEMLLYGAPSTFLNTALWTRGVLSPRSPINFNDFHLEAAVAATAPIKTLYDMMDNVITLSSNGASLPSSVMSALQLQTLSRPTARMADMFVGHSIDQRGGTVDPNAGFKLNLATFARAMGSRSLQEGVVRDASYQQSYYNSANYAAKREVMRGLRAGGNKGDAFREYQNLGGSAKGFNKALNKIYLEDTSGKAATLDDTRLNLAIKAGLY